MKVEDPATAEDWATALAELMPHADLVERGQAAERLRRSLSVFLDQEDTLVDTAMCLGAERVGGADKLSYGVLIVSVRPSRHTERLLAAEGIYRAKEQLFFERDSEVEELDFALGKGARGRQDMLLAAKLPSGPGVMSTSLRTVQLSTAEQTRPGTDGPASPKIPMAVLQLIIPAPRDYCVYVTLSTPSVYLLDSYSERLAYIGRTLAFDAPDAVTGATESRIAQAGADVPRGDGA
ncbi:hypothetical protein [Streptomyces sp. NPDC056821]|uniref:hypothetical protein n=1 Tax=unclassified Streptomyces TaxID=2593676 RepID=UPI0036850A56